MASESDNSPSLSRNGTVAQDMLEIRKVESEVVREGTPPNSRSPRPVIEHDAEADDDQRVFLLGFPVHDINSDESPDEREAVPSRPSRGVGRGTGPPANSPISPWIATPSSTPKRKGGGWESVGMERHLDLRSSTGDDTNLDGSWKRSSFSSLHRKDSLLADGGGATVRRFMMNLNRSVNRSLNRPPSHPAAGDSDEVDRLVAEMRSREEEILRCCQLGSSLLNELEVATQELEICRNGEMEALDQLEQLQIEHEHLQRRLRECQKEVTELRVVRDSATEEVASLRLSLNHNMSELERRQDEERREWLENRQWEYHMLQLRYTKDEPEGESLSRAKLEAEWQAGLCEIAVHFSSEATRRWAEALEHRVAEEGDKKQREIDQLRGSLATADALRKQEAERAEEMRSLYHNLLAEHRAMLDSLIESEVSATDDRNLLPEVLGRAGSIAAEARGSLLAARRALCI